MRFEPTPAVIRPPAALDIPRLRTGHVQPGTPVLQCAQKEKANFCEKNLNDHFDPRLVDFRAGYKRFYLAPVRTALHTGSNNRINCSPSWSYTFLSLTLSCQNRG